MAKLQKQAVGKSSEEIEREIAQLELALEDLLIAADSEPLLEAEPPAADAGTAEVKLRRRPTCKPGWLTSSSASTIIKSTASTNCSRGTGRQRSDPQH
jgi:hypothetical protein